MPPKVKVLREDIVRAARDIVREKGDAALSARSVAAVLGCSTQPVFSNFATMEELRLAVADAAEERFREYIREETARQACPEYKAVGSAYIRFAREEKELFKLLYMRDRREEKRPLNMDLNDQMVRLISGMNGIPADSAQLFQLEMWAFVHGIAAMLTTGYWEPEPELISRMLTDAYTGLTQRYETGKEKE